MRSGAPLVLAVDGGGSKTMLALVNADAEVVFLARGASCNPMDNPNWKLNLSELFASAKRFLPAAVHAAIGFPGFGEIPHFDESMSNAAAELFPGPRTLMNDVELALDGAFCDRPGILLLAGTGSMAMAKSTRGRIYRVGGWGDIFGDEGSAYWIGREALSNASQALDGRLNAAGFAQAVFSELRLDTTSGYKDLMGWCYESKHLRSAVASVSSIVDALARSGDPTALSILQRAADHLSVHIDAILNQAGPAYERRWSFAGGVFGSAEIIARLAARHGEPSPPRLIPVAGGLWRAAREASWPVDEAWIAALAKWATQYPDLLMAQDPEQREYPHGRGLT